MLLAILRRDFVPRYASLRALEYLRGRHINLAYAGTIAALDMILTGTSIPSILVDSRLNPLMMAKKWLRWFCRGRYFRGACHAISRSDPAICTRQGSNLQPYDPKSHTTAAENRGKRTSPGLKMPLKWLRSG
jgi:hypothetical protein